MFMNIREMIAGYILYNLQPIYFIYLLCYFTRLRYYCIHDSREQVLPIIAKLKSTAWSPCAKYSRGKEIPFCYFLSSSAVGTIEQSYDDIVLYVLTTQEFYHFLTESDTAEFCLASQPLRECKPRQHENIGVYIRKGGYKNFFYSKITLNLAHLQPMGAQQGVIDDIMQLYKETNRCTVFIHGVANAGKSAVALLVARQLNAKYCHTFHPMDPGDHLSSLLVETEPSADNPLIIVLEEVDEMIKTIHGNRVHHNKEMPRSVHNKSTWCSFLDDMMLYNNLLVIMTSNASKEDIDRLDTAYLRAGRIHKVFDMPHPLQTNEY